MSIYESFGLLPIINASGAVTRLGGAPMPREVLDAFDAAASECVPLEDLQAAASDRIAEATCTDAGLATSGAAASLTLGTAAILCGLDIGRMEALPHCDNFANEFVIAREQRNGYDHAVRAAGARLVEVGMNEMVSNAGVRRTEPWEYENAFGENTAGVLYVHGTDSAPALSEVVAVAHKYGLPVLVDAAGELPPRSNLKDIAATGADLVAFSGGKSIRGPQSTGILCGRQTLITSAALQMLDMDDHWDLWSPPSNLIDKSQLPGMPRHGIGRSLKVSKEEIVALLTALRLFQDGSYDSHTETALQLLHQISGALAALPVTCTIIEAGEKLPLLNVKLGSQCAKSALEVCRNLRNGEPSIYVGHALLSDGIVSINPLHLDTQSAALIAQALIRELQDGS